MAANMKKLMMAAIFALSLIAPAIAAQYWTSTPLTSDVWTDLGTGPLTVEVRSGYIYYAIADEAPASLTSRPHQIGAPGGQGIFREPINTDKHIFARAAIGTAEVVTSPIAASAGGGGGGGAATVADGADVAQGARADAAWTSGSGTTISLLKAIKGGVPLSAALPAGTNNIGDVDVLTLPALSAGSNIIGNVRVDQTTPGTTNGVALSHVGSTAVATGNGVVGAGVQRVAIASDNTAFTVNSAQSGAWTVQPGNTANTTPWLFNQSQINGIALSTGNGVAGTGVQRVTIASDNSSVPVTPAATESHLGQIGRNRFKISSALTTTASGTYVTGEALGALQTLANAARVSGTQGASGTSGAILQTKVTINAPSLTGTAIDVYYFDANPTGSTCTNDAAFALVTADRDKVIAIAHLGDVTAGNTAVIAQATNNYLPYSLSSATSIFACVVVRDSFTLPAGTGNATLITEVERN